MYCRYVGNIIALSQYTLEFYGVNGQDTCSIFSHGVYLHTHAPIYTYTQNKSKCDCGKMLKWGSCVKGFWIGGF